MVASSPFVCIFLDFMSNLIILQKKTGVGKLTWKYRITFISFLLKLWSKIWPLFPTLEFNTSLMKYMVNLRENLALSISKQLELALSGVRKDEREEKRPLQVAKISFA